MKAIRLSLSLLILITMLLSCSKKDSDDVHYRFPLKLGNSWSMQRTLNYYSMETHGMITEIDTLYIWADSLLTSPEGEECTRLKYRYTTFDEGDYSYDYVVNRADGFYELGWKDSQDFLPTKAAKTGYTGNPFHPFVSASSSRDEVWLSEPIMRMPYECKEGTRWNNAESEGHLACSYLIMPKEAVSTPLGTLKCFRRKSTVYYKSKDTVEYYNHYNQFGIVKFRHDDIETITDENGNIIGDFPFHDEIKLIGYHLN